MRPRSPAPLLPLALAMLLASACAGCRPVDQEAAAGTEEAAGTPAPRLPAIHAVLRWETLGAGRNQARADYQARLEACTSAGIATVPLGQDEIDRLDTGRIEIAINSSRQRVRQTRWTLGMDDGDPGVQGACRFHLAEDVAETTPEDTMDMSWTPLEADPAAEAAAAARLGWTGLGQGSVAGQPCRRWRRSVDGKGPVEDACVWSGGRQWGFSDGPLSAAPCAIASPAAYLASIPLEAKPLQGHGCVVQVESFSVGQDRPPAAAAATGGGR